MIDIQTIADVALLREACDLECKLAAGRDGQGAVPDDFWPTYSAFANTEGGVVVLGLREKHERFTVEGIVRVAKVRKELFDALNNRNKVSVNLLTDSHVREAHLNGRTLLVVEVPRANRKQRPVHLTTNPFAGNTYRRLNDGDRPVPDDDVRRMIAEQVEDSRDSRILVGYGVDDLCLESFRAYRQVFANREPAHPWNALEDVAFLRQLGGWRLDRETEEGGVTIAGVLMFGWMTTIQEVLPNYMLDYQERPEARIDQRWVDRLTLDGKWSGNLYDFYRKVYLKLTADLKVPFTLEKGQRQDETPVHVALREALANVLVHGDYTDRASVLVVKRPDMFGFRNPGLMRIPPEVAIRGGEHDCRNRTLHKMFRLVGVGEQAGSGIPKIYGSWANQHWRTPSLYERSEPYNQTLLELHMADLLPAALLQELRASFGPRFDALATSDRLTLAAAAAEQVITHARVREMTGIHPFDASRLLQGLVRDGFLELHNPGRGAVYCIPGAAIPKPEEVFGASSEHLPVSSEHLAASSEHFPVLAAPPGEQRDDDGCLLSDQLDAPIVDLLQCLKPELLVELELLAASPRAKAKIPPTAMREVLLAVCTGRYVALSAIAELVSRDPDALRQQHLKPLVKEGKLRLAFPTAPTHARQAYRAGSG